MKTNLKSKLGVILLAALMPTAALAGDCGRGKLRVSREASLRRTAILVLKAIQRRNSTSLVSFLDPRGMGFGVDQAPLSVGEIRRHLRDKQGVYCLLFSTPCIIDTAFGKNLRTDPVLSKWTISYADWLNQSAPYSPETELLDDDGSEMCGGLVTVRARIELEPVPNSLELQFVYLKNHWVLSNTPNSLGE